MENSWQNIHDLIQEVRGWSRKWVAYDLTHKDMPPSLGEFVDELLKKYEVKLVNHENKDY